MRINVTIGVDDLAATRFAVSPLHETITAVRLLRHPEPHPVNQPWLRWARGELARRHLAAARLWPLLMASKRSWPEFLAPAPAIRAPSLAEELNRMRATPVAQVRASLSRVFRDVDPWPDSAAELFRQPERTLELLAEEITEAHDRLIASHWDRMRAVLDADIAYRGGILASDGAGALLVGLHPELRWSAGTLSFIRGGKSGEDEVQLGRDGGLVLVPTVFGWPYAIVKLHTSSQTTIRYPARGTATVWETGPLPECDTAAVRDLLGAPRARLLGMLRSPATTTALARSLGITPAAVSQHLAILRRGGLVDRTRAGRGVLYQASDLGLALLDVGAVGRTGGHGTFIGRRSAGRR
jgi:DNA-binding transcriptional ArsR family regulator